MKPFAEALEREWAWKRPGMWRRRFELRAGGELLAVLESRAPLGATLWGQTAGGEWQVRHMGLLRGWVRVTPAGGGDAVAEFHPRWFGAGDVTTRGGQALRWHRADFWGRRWEMVDSGGLMRLAFERGPGFLNPDTFVRLSPAARADPELEPLVLLGFYILLLMVRQAQSAL
jgi:hypothetical protein